VSVAGSDKDRTSKRVDVALVATQGAIVPEQNPGVILVDSPKERSRWTAAEGPLAIITFPRGRVGGLDGHKPPLQQSHLRFVVLPEVLHRHGVDPV
jgi:hypothetical protein